MAETGSEPDFAVSLIIDGVHVDERVLLVALGIDVDGNKHVLGLREGATENSTACKELLADLVERGLRTHYTILAVLDGSKALAKAVGAVWGKRVLIQRCQVHKLRNVTDQLPESTRDDLPEWLERTLVTTNAIENLIGSVRNLGHRVRRWRDGTMILRWAATALIEASKQFRKLRGYAGMGKLAAALRAHDAALDGGVDGKENAA